MNRKGMLGVAAGALVATLAVAADDVTETVDLTITGGANAGKWNASTKKGGCSANLTGPGTWGNQMHATDQGANKFTSLQLIVPDARKAASGTNEFYMTVRFGPLIGGNTTYAVDTQATSKKKVGSGTLKVADRGATAEVMFSGTTADGVKLEGTIHCNSVTRG